MRSRYPSASSFSYSFGPGPVTPVIKVLIGVNVAAFIITFFMPVVMRTLWLRPADVVEHFAVWQIVTYMFLHAGAMHLLLNMLILWYFGAEPEMRLGENGFLRYFLICGIGAGFFAQFTAAAQGQD